MTRLSAALDAVDTFAEETITRALRGDRCLRCHRRVRTNRYVIVIDRLRGPRQLHRRCARPLRLTDRGRMVRDLVVCAFAACAVVAICTVIVVNWPALAALMRQP